MESNKGAAHDKKAAANDSEDMVTAGGLPMLDATQKPKTWKRKPPKRPKSRGIGRQGQKKSKTWQEYKTAIHSEAENVGGVEVDPAGDPAINPARPPGLPPAPQFSRTRRDGNWRTHRGIQTRDRKIEKMAAKLSSLEETNAVLQKKTKEADSEARIAEHQRFADNKASREMAIEREEQHKAELREQHEKLDSTIQEAFEERDMAIAKTLALEQALILAEERRRGA